MSRGLSPDSWTFAAARRGCSVACLVAECAPRTSFSDRAAARPRGRAARRLRARRGRGACRTPPGGRRRRRAPRPGAAIRSGVPEKANRSSTLVGDEARRAGHVAGRELRRRRRRSARPRRRRWDRGRRRRARYIATWRRACSRARPSSRSTTVTAPATMPTSRGTEPLAGEPHHRRVRAPAELELVGVLGGERRQARRPAADEERHPLPLARVGEAGARARAGRPRPRTRSGRRRAGATRSPTPRRSSRPAAAARARARRATRRPPGRGTRGRRRRGRAPRSGRRARPDAPVNGFRHDGPTRTRSVAPAISSSAGSAGWNQRSLKVVTTSKPPRSAIRASAAYSPGRLSVCSPSPSSRRSSLTSGRR